jgi:AraC family transcriptional regulator
MTLRPQIPEFYNHSDFGLDSAQLLMSRQSSVPGSVAYRIDRFRKPQSWSHPESIQLKYSPGSNAHENGQLLLQILTTNNFLCQEKALECDRCRMMQTPQCSDLEHTVDLMTFVFTPLYLLPFVRSNRSEPNLLDQVFSFEYPQPLQKKHAITPSIRQTVEGFLNQPIVDETRANIFFNAQIQLLLLHAADEMLTQKLPERKEWPKFLAHESDRERILQAREILLQHIGQPLTIRALSRKVAMNECYLKKGFKEIFGTTIFEFYQNQRMEHAKYLLYEKRFSVTEVSSMLGYSSISHFSTAFKKHTGLKPCELLNLDARKMG